MAADLRFLLIGSLWLSAVICLCNAAPLAKEQGDEIKASHNWPIKDTEQYDYNPLTGKLKI